MRDSRRTFLRPVDGRVVAGVAAALARRLGLDATVIRGALVVLAAWVGIVEPWALLVVLAGYGAAVAAIPPEERSRGHERRG